MHIFNNIKSFLYENDNFITILDNKVYLYNILSILLISNYKIIVLFNNKKVSITGDDLRVVRSENKELELIGNIKGVFIDEVIN